MSRWLSREDVALLTGKKRAKAQVRALRRRRIPFTPDGDGFPLVLPEAVDGRPAKARNSGPRWHLINA